MWWLITCSKSETILPQTFISEHSRKDHQASPGPLPVGLITQLLISTALLSLASHMVRIPLKPDLFF